MENPILFVTYGGGHMHMVIAVAKALEKRADSPPIKVLGMPAAAQTLRSAGLNVVTFNDFLDPESDRDAIEWGTSLLEGNHNPDAGIPVRETVAYMGLSYKDLVLRHGVAEAKRLFRRKGRKAFHPVTVLSRCIEHLKPCIVVSTNSPRAEAAAIDAAKAAGLPNIVMTDLFLGMMDYPIVADDVTFLNEFALEGFCRFELFDKANSQSHCVGNPAFDNLLSRNAEPDVAWLQTWLPDLPIAPSVLHADMPAWFDEASFSSYTKTETECIAEMDAVYNGCQLAGANYLVRPHPSQNRAIFEQFVAEHSGAYLAASLPLHDLLGAVDLVVARSTTVALEAVYLRQKVLQLDPELHFDLPLAQMGVAAGAKLDHNLASAIRLCLEDDEAHLRRLAHAETVLPRLPAAHLIADLILKRVGPKFERPK